MSESNKVERVYIPLAANVVNGIWAVSIGERSFGFKGDGGPHNDDQATHEGWTFITGVIEGVRLTGKAAEVYINPKLTLLAEPGGINTLLTEGGEPIHLETWGETFEAIRLLNKGVRS